MPIRFNSTLSHYYATELEVHALESDVLSVSKTNVIWSTQTGFQAVRTHAASEFIETPEVVGTVLRLQVEISDWWMVRGVLTVDIRSISKLPLESLSKDRVEGLILTCADVQATHREGDNLLEAL